MIAHAAFDSAHSVFEFGCGTGAFAARLLQHHLPADASYVGLDISDTMVLLAQERLKPWSERARVHQSDGTPRISGLNLRSSHPHCSITDDSDPATERLTLSQQTVHNA
jgi:SAM-dependent methyltransferase